jgi:hypothetical protein
MKIQTSFDVGQQVIYQAIPYQVVVVYIRVNKDELREEYLLERALGPRVRIKADQLCGAGPGFEHETLVDVGDKLHRDKHTETVKRVLVCKSHQLVRETYSGWSSEGFPCGGSRRELEGRMV